MVTILACKYLHTTKQPPQRAGERASFSASAGRTASNPILRRLRRPRPLETADLYIRHAYIRRETPVAPNHPCVPGMERLLAPLNDNARTGTLHPLVRHDVCPSQTMDKVHQSFSDAKSPPRVRDTGTSVRDTGTSESGTAEESFRHFLWIGRTQTQP